MRVFTRWQTASRLCEAGTQPAGALRLAPISSTRLLTCDALAAVKSWLAVLRRLRAGAESEAAVHGLTTSRAAVGKALLWAV